MPEVCRVTKYRDVAEARVPLALVTDKAVASTDYDDETPVERYYRFQSSVYDATRWTFLFGRSKILRRVADRGSPERILEVGCGTGRNLLELACLFPAARITGVDLSKAMLERARRKTASVDSRVELVHGRYDKPLYSTPRFDLVLFSYSLTMFNPGFELAIESARSDLVQGGYAATVDFHDSPLPWFTSWMQINHVRTDGQLRPLLQRRFQPLHDELRLAYGGAWRYFLFLGQ